MDKLLINTVRLGRLSYEDDIARANRTIRTSFVLLALMVTAIFFFNLGVALEKTKFSEMVSYDKQGRLK